MTAQLPRPGAGEYGEFYAGYVAEMPDGDVLAALERQGEETFALFSALPEERGGYRYAPGKWAIKDLVTHLADAERVFAYRALRFARGDATPLAGFDEGDYVGPPARSAVPSWISPPSCTTSGGQRSRSFAVFPRTPPRAPAPPTAPLCRCEPWPG